MGKTARLVIAVLALAGGIAASGCGGGKAEYVDVEQRLGFDQDSLILRQSRAEARIRDCMKSQGFDYVPVDPVAERARLFGTANPRDEQFGYYVTTLWGHSQPHADPNER
jgi:hypothetical protein